MQGDVQVQWLSDFRTAVYPRYSFILRRARVQFQYEPFRFGTNVEIGADELPLELKDAFVYYRVTPALRFFAGLGKVSFSLEELTPARKLLLIERSRTNRLFSDYGYLGRNVGLTVEGERGPSRGVFGYAIGLY